MAHDKANKNVRLVSNSCHSFVKMYWMRKIKILFTSLNLIMYCMIQNIRNRIFRTIKILKQELQHSLQQY